MKKNILFMIINMNIGGTEKALLNMIAEINPDEYNVTLLMLEEYGGFLEELPRWISIKYLDGYNKMRLLLNNPLHHLAMKEIKKFRFIKFSYLIFLYVVTKIAGNQILLYKHLLKKHALGDEYYDIAIAYAGPMDFISYYVINKVQAKKKLQWIHFDVTKIGFNCNFAKRVYPKFDHIFVVSKEGKEKLLQLMPQLDEKVDVFQNIISKDLVIKKSKEDEGFIDDYQGIRILTVGRLDFIKGQDLCIEAARLLRQEGYDFRWYCLGEGKFRKELEQLIKQYQLEHHFILLGSSTNPYPYMAECDLYVQPSRHEGFCITLGEAKVFNKPIISTNFTGAKEQLNHYASDSEIVSVDSLDITKSIKKFLNERKLS